MSILTQYTHIANSTELKFLGERVWRCKKDRPEYTSDQVPSLLHVLGPTQDIHPMLLTSFTHFPYIE